MALTGSGEIQLTEIYAEFTGTHSSEEIQLTDYYDTGNAPASGEIQLAADFYGTAGATWYGTKMIVSGGDTAPTQAGGTISQQNMTTISSTSSASSYGYMVDIRHRHVAVSDGTYIWYFGGATTLDVALNNIEKKVFASSGNASDVGDMGRVLYWASGVSNGVRGVVGHGITVGYSPTYQDAMNYLTYASDTSMTSFGDLRNEIANSSSHDGDTRGIFLSGRNSNSGTPYQIDYITIASASNYTNFGIITGYNGHHNGIGVGSSTRAWFVGGYGGASGANMNQMMYLTVASTGNSTDGGNLHYYNYRMTGAADGTKAEIAHGIAQQTLGHSTYLVSTTSYWTISSTSNSVYGRSMGGWGLTDSEGAAGT